MVNGFLEKVPIWTGLILFHGLQIAGFHFKCKIDTEDQPPGEVIMEAERERIGMCFYIVFIECT